MKPCNETRECSVHVSTLSMELLQTKERAIFAYMFVQGASGSSVFTIYNSDDDYQICIRNLSQKLAHQMNPFLAVCLRGQRNEPLIVCTESSKKKAI